MEIVLGNLHASRSEINYKLNVPKSLRKYFLYDNSYVRYNGSIDLRNVNNSILAIPIVALLAPMAWAVGFNIIVDELDTTYSQSLIKIKETYRSLYSNFSFQSDIHFHTAVNNEFDQERTAILFSGGVDSLASYLRIKDRKPDFISVFGIPILTPFEEKFWINMWNDICSIANVDKVATIPVKTDMPRSINYELLERQFGLRWYSDVAFGLLLLGLCAPITPVLKVGTLVIPSSYSPGSRRRSGSNPLTDSIASWADVKVIHEGHELSRQQKLTYLCQSENLPYLAHLRVCWEGSHRTNCGKCEKCMRTIAGLLAAGVNPNRCNFEIDSKTFTLIKDYFQKGIMQLREEQLVYWRDIQKHISKNAGEQISGSHEFLTWLKGYDLLQYSANKRRQLGRSLYRLFRNRRLSTPDVSKKIKSYWYMSLARLKLL